MVWPPSVVEGRESGGLSSTGVEVGGLKASRQHEGPRNGAVLKDKLKEQMCKWLDDEEPKA